MRSKCCATGFAALALAVLSATPTALGEVQKYLIQPGGIYTYLPSPFTLEGVGIAGCSPSDFQCTFGISGTFSVDYDRTLDTAQLLDLNLTLTGNASVQSSPPPLLPVTSGRVADWLAARFFELDVFNVGPYDLYEDQTYPALELTDLLDGTILIGGGYNLTSVDGDGMLFDFGAIAVPEPASGAMAALGLAALLTYSPKRLAKR